MHVSIKTNKLADLLIGIKQSLNWGYTGIYEVYVDKIFVLLLVSLINLYSNLYDYITRYKCKST